MTGKNTLELYPSPRVEAGMADRTYFLTGSFKNIRPDLDPSQILNRLARLHAQFSRRYSVDKSLSDDYQNLLGSLHMMEGLIYHHDVVRLRWAGTKNLANENKFWTELSEKATEEDHVFSPGAWEVRGIFHEMIGWINRLGQFYTFAKAQKIENLMPRANELMIFRDKVAAHRSVDKPWRDDTEEDMRSQLWDFGGQVLLSVDGSPGLQLDARGKHYEFVFFRDHVSVLAECEAVLSHAFKVGALDVPKK